MSAKRVNPYEALRRRCKDWARSVVYPTKVAVWYWKKPECELQDLYGRVHAADKLGYDTRLEARDDKSLHVVYVKRPGDPPREIAP